MNNLELASAVRPYAGNAGFWWGGLGLPGTEEYLNMLAAQMPAIYNKHYRKACEIWLKKPPVRVFDSAGFIKYFSFWRGDPVHNYRGVEDLSADAMFAKSRRKGKINEMPELAGLGLWRTGHVGVYIGGGKLIEAMGLINGVVLNDLKTRNFTDWFEIPNIDYIEPSELTFVSAQRCLLRRGLLGDQLDARVSSLAEFNGFCLDWAHELFLEFDGGVRPQTAPDAVRYLVQIGSLTDEELWLERIDKIPPLREILVARAQTSTGSRTKSTIPADGGESSPG